MAGTILRDETVMTEKENGLSQMAASIIADELYLSSHLLASVIIFY